MLQESLSPDAHPCKPLTRMETRVLGLVIEGKSSKEIAKALYRSPRTIEGHRSNLMRKLGANNLLDILKRTMEMCLIDMSAKPELSRMKNVLYT
jgi:DNA-binding NarL/FixJ family response regulator